MSAEIARVPFLAGHIETVLVDGEPRVIVRPTLASMGLDADSQMKKLRRKSWATTVMTTVVADDGKAREMATVDLDTWSMLLANIDEQRVSEAARPLVIEYQKKSARALREFWTQGGSVNPAATREQVADLRERLDGVDRARLAQERLSAMGVAKQFGLVNDSYVQAMARTELARMNGEEPDVDPADITITCDEFLTERGVTGAALRSARTRLGKTVATLYRARYDRAPQSIKRPIDGVHRDVKVYTHRDIDLFEKAWAELGRHYDVQTAIGGAA
ncbi:phage antirepressor N-terminal domain-containing protein [Streptomyces sp. NPDC060194]|uniref:phage antirepressor N-terminal domain-containing protein n=1 Tax=Streptomyces sp. NPDC060194 TaxID=3347069 RepID=UPI00364D9815